MRVSEALRLTSDMVDERQRGFRLPDSKTGKRIVPVSAATLHLVRECPRVCEESELDPSPYMSSTLARAAPRAISHNTRTGERQGRAKTKKSGRRS